MSETAPSGSLVLPDDQANRELIAQVHPPSWRNPKATGTYDLVVLGGGTAGLVSAVGAAGLGARVALVERHLLGGDCLNTGCVPSKALLRSARALGELQRAASLGVRVEGASVDFAAVMQRMRERRAAIAPHDSAARLAALGIDVFFGDARFADPRSVTVGGERLRFQRAVIATGGRPAVPSIPGLDQTPYFTSDTIFSMTTLPRRLAVIGAGPIGCELAQAFARFGSTVFVFDQGTQVLPRESRAAARLLQRQLESDGVHLHLQMRITSIVRRGSTAVLEFQAAGAEGAGAGGDVAADAVLVAAGRAPNLEGLGLEAAGIASGPTGVSVNDRLQTTNSRVFASGDVCSHFKFTHAADALSRIVIANALFFGRQKASALTIPWVTYTDPEIAHVGVSEANVHASGGRLATITVELADLDRAVVDDDTGGIVQVHHEGGALRGCTIVAPHAGDMIGEAVYALTHGGTLGRLSATVHPYPTLSEALRKAGDAYRRQALTSTRKQWLKRYFRLTR